MREVTLNAPKEVIQINYGEESFSLPLAGSLPFDMAMKMRKGKSENEMFEAMLEFLKTYTPEEIYKQLTSDEIKIILQNWSEASQEASGITPGE